MRAIARALAELEPDVVALQELWNPGPSQPLIDGLYRSGLEHRWTDGIGLGNGGLAIVSRFPITRTRFTRFRVQGRPEKVRHGDYYGGKGFVEAAIDVGGRSVTVFNTHLHSRHVSSAPHRYTAERIAQAVELAFAVEGAPSPGVVVGDFNMSPRGAVYEVFRALSACSDAALEDGNPRTTHFHRASGRRERLDYVFIKNREADGLKVEKCAIALDEELSAGLPVRRFSDHAAVVVDLDTRSVPAPESPDYAARERAIATAVAITRDARRELIGRRRQLRAGAVAGVGMVAGGVVLHRKLERRAFLKATTVVAAGLAGLTTGGLLSLSEYSSRHDLGGFDHVLQLLESMPNSTKAG